MARLEHCFPDLPNFTNSSQTEDNLYQDFIQKRLKSMRYWGICA
ncbi:hypothetical protein [Coleofasciculus sp.]